MKGNFKHRVLIHFHSVFYLNLSLSRCETLIKQGITVENVAMLYATAIKFSAEELEEFCFRFSLNHMVIFF